MPKGWYHEVESDCQDDDGSGIFAINIWLNSVEDVVTKENEDFLLRYLLNKKIEKEASKSASELMIEE